MRVREPRSVRLPDGRKLSYTDLGDPDGHVVFLFHGTPACSAGYDSFDGPARAAGLRAIAPDRPGIRLSSFQRGRNMPDWPADVAALADALGAERFSVLGWSGGGPYALACGAGLADRLAACVVVAGVAPPEMPDAVETLGESDKRLTRMAGRSPLAARLTLRTLAFLAKRFPDRARETMRQELGDVDADVLNRYWPGEFTLFTEAFRLGARGVALDYALFGRPWGFDLAEVSAPVRIWHGDSDRSVPLEHGRWLADRLPDARLDVVPGAGHFFVLDRAEQLLEAARG